LHALGIAHRDLKPSNLLLDAGSIWITDFGIAARAAPVPQSDSGNTWLTWQTLPSPLVERSAGTPPFAAPELSHDPPAITPASDVYSLGALWRWLATRGNHGNREMHLTQRESQLLGAMLAVAPDDRPTASEALEMVRTR
jgi:serine/threonine protein kinase